MSAAVEAPPLTPVTLAPATTPRPRRARRAPLRAFFASWILLFSLSAIWAVATPPSASPDEPAHIVRAASVVRGEFIGTPSPNGEIVSVPRYIAQSHAVTCFAFNPAVTADCARLAAADPWQNVQAPTSAGLYNPLYYAIVGWPSLVLRDSAGVYGMRVMSALLASLFAALAFAVVSTFRSRRLPLLAFAVAVTPMLLFLGGTVNPSAVEATATVAVFCAMLGIVFSPDAERLTGRAVVVMAAAAVAVNARGLSPLWVLLALVVPLLLIDRGTAAALLRRPAVLTLAAVVGAATIAAGAWTLGTNSLANAIAHPEQALSFPGVGSSPLVGFEKVFLGTVSYSQGLVGLFGWLDTPAPDAVLYGWGLAIGALAVGAVVVLRRRRLLTAWVLVAAFLVCPAIVQAAYIHGGGMIWQGRYNLPLFLCLVVGLATLMSDLAFRSSAHGWRRIALIVIAGATVGQVWAFTAALRRYAVGADGSLRTFLLGQAPWAPAGGVLLWLAVFTAVTGTAGVLLLRSLIRTTAVPVLPESPEVDRSANAQPGGLTPAGTGL